MKLALNSAAVVAVVATILLSGCGGESTPSANKPKLLANIVTGTDQEIAPETTVDLVFSMRLHNRMELDQFVSDIQTPGHAKYRQTMSYAELVKKFAPKEGEAKAVAAFLEAKGFTNLNISSDNLLIQARASAAVIASALGTKLVERTLPNGKRAFTNTKATVLPENLQALVQDIIGLDTTHNPHSLVDPGVLVGHNPRDFPALYNVGSTPAATNIDVGMLAFGDMTPVLSDLRKFEQQNGLATTTTAIVGTTGTDVSGTIEWSLDSQTLVAMAGGVRQLKFYVGPTFTWANVAAAAQRAIADGNNPARVINMSFGACEGSISAVDPIPRNTLDNLFVMAIAQGRTFVAASGDSGSSNTGCTGNSVMYPASSPYVVAVGGTTLKTNTLGYESETAWSGSGGGTSKLSAIPAWQAIVPALANTKFRSLPDLAFNADGQSGALIYVNGQLRQLGGTSLAAPMFAATWARMLQSPGCNNLGFASPTLYAYRNLHQTMFNDITIGSNGAFSAGNGWDNVTGWGTPNISNMWATVCPSGAAYYQIVEKIYLAYLGRPIDPSGLANMASTLQNGGAPTDIVAMSAAYNTNATVKTIIDSIHGSAEANSVFPTSNPTSYLNAIFQALIARAPTAAEAALYVNAQNQFIVPKQTIALKIMGEVRKKGAPMQDIGAFKDLIVLENKAAVAFNFTASLTPQTASSFSGDVAATTSRHLIQQVTNDGSASDSTYYFYQPTYVSAKQININSAIAAIVAGIPQ